MEQLDVADLDCIYSSCASSRERCYSVIRNGSMKERTVMHFVQPNCTLVLLTVF